MHLERPARLNRGTDAKSRSGWTRRVRSHGLLGRGRVRAETEAAREAAQAAQDDEAEMAQAQA